MNWKQKQLDAIEKRDSNLLVSAAAGSGKTAVLVERIKRLIIDEGHDIEGFLVVTFTKAAASEMKEKLAKALRQAMKEPGVDGAYLKRQLELLPRADISTFDSFALKVDQNYFHLLDIDPAVSLIDEVQGRILKQDVMDETFDAFFETSAPEFITFLDHYSKREDEKQLKAALLSLYEKLRSFPNYMDWFRDQVAAMEPADMNAFRKRYQDLMYREAMAMLAQAMESFSYGRTMLENAGCDSLAEKMTQAMTNLQACMDSPKEGFWSALDAFSAPSLSPKNEEKEAWEIIRSDVSALKKEGTEAVKHLRTQYGGCDWQKEWERLPAQAADAKVMLAILTDFEERYRAAKKRQGAIDFADIEHLANEALAHPEVAQVYRDKFDFIFIDEYQDSNYLQEAIIDKIRREDNLFMVGDVKQSIYGFRMAEPEIFQQKYEDYGSGDLAGEALDLNENFRSKTPIIRTVNNVFENLMDGYGEEQALHPGAVSDRDVNYPVALHVIHTDDKRSDELDDALADLQNQEYEAMEVCQVIEEYLGKPYYDPKTDELRTFRLKDIVILLRSVKTAGPLFKEILAKAGYDAYLDESSGFFDTLEIATFTDLLAVIDNPRRDLPLLSALRSFLLHFSLEELIDIRLGAMDTESYYDAFVRYGEEGTNPALQQKVRDTLASLSRWRNKARYMPIDEFLWMLLQETGYEVYMGALPGGTQRLANLRALVDRAIALKQRGEVKIYDFLRFVEALTAKERVDMGSASILGEGEDVIRIMTIHQSKGLEFPLVFVCGAGKGFNHTNDFTGFVIDRDVGLAMEYVDDQLPLKSKTLPLILAMDKAKRKDREEEIRVLYVAATRARDALVFTGTMTGKRPANSYLRWLLPVFEASNNDALEVSHVYLEEMSTPTAAQAPKTGPATSVPASVTEETEAKLGYVYPAREALNLRSKYTVSELNHPTEAAIGLHRPAFAAGDEELAPTGADLGTLYHLVLEHLDFVSLVGVKDQGGEEALREAVALALEDMVAWEIMLPEEKNLIDVGFVADFFSGELAGRMARAAELHKETPFTLYHEVEGRRVLVQGIIDCWFLEGEDIVLVDYKSNLREENIRETYQEQMAIYREALEKLTGRRVKEAYLYLIRHQKVISMM